MVSGPRSGQGIGPTAQDPWCYSTLSQRVGCRVPAAAPPERLRSVAEAAEAAGVAQLWLWEDSFFEGGIASASGRAGLDIAAAGGHRAAPGAAAQPRADRHGDRHGGAAAPRSLPARARPRRARLDGAGGRGGGVADDVAAEYTAAVRALLAGERVSTDRALRAARRRGTGVAAGEPAPAAGRGRAGPRPCASPGELGDGLLLDSSATLDAVRAARATVDEVRADRPFQVVLNLLVDDLGAVSTRVAAAKAAARTWWCWSRRSTRPDPMPLIAAPQPRLSSGDPPPAGEPFDGRGDTRVVAGGEQVEHRAAQHGEDSVRSAGSAAKPREQGQPVVDRGGGEARPRAVRLDERAGVGLGPQREEAAVLGRGQPPPQRRRRPRRACPGRGAPRGAARARRRAPAPTARGPGRPWSRRGTAAPAGWSRRPGRAAAATSHQAVLAGVAGRRVRAAPRVAPIRPRSAVFH